MNAIDVFSVRDLRIRSSRLMKDAEEGRLSIITKHGKPTILAVPFGEQMLRFGVEKDLAIQLFRTGGITLAKAARIADMAMADFMELLALVDVPAVDYPASELAHETVL